MKKVYAASNLQEAYIVLNLLKNAGLEAYVFNENAQGGTGELPFTHTWPEIWIDNEENLDAAKEIIESYETSGSSDRIIKCRHCHEENPENFTVCWSCGENITPVV